MIKSVLLDSLCAIIASKDVIYMRQERIKQTVLKLLKRYGTQDPFILADYMGILVSKEDLGTLSGYYTKKYRIKHIHVNASLTETELVFACAHELGHAILHPDANTPFLTKHTYLSIDKYEIEANKFAIELLLSDDTLLEYQNCTIEQVVRSLGYHKKLIELKLR